MVAFTIHMLQLGARHSVSPHANGVHWQREELSDALATVRECQPQSGLAGLQKIIGKRVLGTGQYVVDMQSSQNASLHFGTTKLSVKQARVGSVEDCYAFIPYELGEDTELNVLEVAGIAVLQWDPAEAEEDALDDDIQADEMLAGECSFIPYIDKHRTAGCCCTCLQSCVPI